MEIARLTAIYEGDTGRLERAADKADARLRESQGVADKATEDIRKRFGINADIIRRKSEETYTAVAQSAATASTQAVRAMDARTRSELTGLQRMRLSFAEFERLSAVLGNTTAEQIRAQTGRQSSYTNALIAESGRAIQNAQRVATNATGMVERTTTRVAVSTIQANARLSSYSNALIAESQRAIAQAQRAATGAAGSVERVSARVAAATNAAGTGLSDMIGPASGVAVAVTAAATAVAALGVGVFKLAHAFSEYGTTIKNASDQTGISVETLSALNVGIEHAGAKFSQVINSIDNYIKRISEAKHGNREAAADFKQFGIDVNAAFRDPDAAIQLLLKRLAETSNASERLHIATKLAGEGGAILARVAVETGGDLEKLRKKAEELGLMLSSTAARQAKEFDRSLGDLILQAKGLAYTVGREVGPEILRIINDISAALGTSKSSWDDWGRFLREVIASARVALVGFYALANEGWVPGAGFLAAKEAMEREANRFAEAEQRRRFTVADPAQGRGDLAAAQRRAGMPGPGGIGDRPGRTRSGESAARRAARQALEATQIDLKAAERLSEAAIAIARRGYDEQLSALDDYNQARIAAEQLRYNKEKDVFDREQALIAASNFEAGERALKERDLQERRAAAETRNQQALNQIAFEGRQERLRIEREHNEALIRLAETSNRTLEMTQEEAIRAGLTTHEEAEGVRFNALRRIMEERMRLLNDELARVAGSPEATRAVQDQINQLMEEANQARKQHERNVKDARRADLEDAQRYTSALRSIYAEISQISFDVIQSQIDALRNQPLRRNEEIEASRQLARMRERERTRLALLELTDQRMRASLIENAEERLRITQAIDARIEAEHLQHAQRIADIEREAAEQLREQLLEIAQDAADITSSTLQRLFSEGPRSALEQLFQDISRTLDRVVNELINALMQSVMGIQPQGSKAGGIIGWLSNFLISSIFGGGISAGTAAAHGGFHGLALQHGGNFNLPRGGPVLVGERGPEVLWMGAGAKGHVTPNNELGKQEVHNHFHFHATREQNLGSRQTQDQAANYFLARLQAAQKYT